MRKQLYQSIIAQLKLIQLDVQGKYITATTLDNAKSAIRTFDVWNNNIRYIADELPFALPAVFLQFQPIQWEQRSKGVRAADVGLTLHIITANRAPSSNKVGHETQALAFFDLLDAINANLYGLKSDFFRNLVSTSSATDHDHDELIDSQETYTVQLTDKSAVKVLPTVTATPVVSVGFNS